jgi:hypothetical protein
LFGLLAPWYLSLNFASEPKTWYLITHSIMGATGRWIKLFWSCSGGAIGTWMHKKIARMRVGCYMFAPWEVR